MIYERARCRHGDMTWMSADTHVGRCLGLYGEFSEEEVSVLCYLAPEGGLVVEAGANIGALTVPIARKVGQAGRLVAIEPQRHCFQVLCANLVANELTNVYALHGALGDSEGWIGVPLWKEGEENNFGGMELLRSRPAGTQMEGARIMTLDSMALPRLDLLKADVEGMEAHVVRGGMQTIERFRPVLYLEHSEVIDDAPMRSLLEKLGYSAYWHLPPLFSEANFRGEAKNIFPGILSINMLFVPAGRELEITGLAPIASGDWRRDHSIAPQAVAA